MPEQAKTTIPVKKSPPPTALRLVPPTDLFERIGKIYDSVARRAFELFESNGRAFGRDLEHWLQAEAELLHPVHVDMTESEEGLAVRAEVPGFTAKDLEVSIEPHRLTISGKRESQEERKGKKVIYQERCSDQIMRMIDLPVAVDGDKASATLRNGLLEVNLPKAVAPKKIRVQTKGGNADSKS